MKWEWERKGNEDRLESKRICSKKRRATRTRTTTKIELRNVFIKKGKKDIAKCDGWVTNFSKMSNLIQIHFAWKLSSKLTTFSWTNFQSSKKKKRESGCNDHQLKCCECVSSHSM